MSKSELEAFEAQTPNKYTDPLLFVHGEYNFSQAGKVPYLVTAMPLQDIVTQIKLVEDIPDEVRLDWSLEELFQRDISRDRVETDLVNGYLKDPNKLSFFNSLTIALLPQKGLEIEESYGQPESIPEASYSTWERVDVGNICVEYTADKSIGAVRWNKERVFPVAIDGQHRLAALRCYHEDLAPNSPELQTKIPLILLILDSRVGFTGRSEKSLIGTLREIFIDLNKNARRVPKSRLILLEDLNMQSLCVRTLLASKAKESSNALPLSLVTWREDEAKFDSGYSITSVLNLNEIVRFCLGQTSLEAIDPLEPNQIKNCVSNINGKLELSATIQKSLKDHINLCIGRIEPFSFKDEHLDAFRAAFCKQWAPHIVRVFREFTPYERYLSTANQIGAIDGLLADYLLLPKEKQQEFRTRRKATDETFNPESAIDTPLNTLENSKKNEWAYYVVFQKALFLNLFDLEAQCPSLFDDEITREDFLTWWINQINALYNQGVFYLDWEVGKGTADLWKGIANNPVSGTIQYTQAAANRISAFITLCIWFNRDSTQLESASAFATRLMKSSAPDSDTQLPAVVGSAFTRVRSGLETLIKSRTDDEVDEKQMTKDIKAELVKRFKAIQS